MRILALLLLSAAAALAQPVTLTWDRHATHPTNQAFALKWGTTTNAITNRIASAGNTFALTNGPWGPLLLQVVAVSTNGIDSDPSNTLSVTNRPGAPLQLRIVPDTTAVQLEGSFNGGATWKPLALVTNDPATILGSMSAMMLRARSVPPPPLP